MGATSSGPDPAPAPVRPPQGRAVGSWVRALLSRAGSVPVSVPVPVPGLALAPRGPAEEPPLPGWPLPQLVSLFLPEFPVRPSARQQQLKILGFVAKGSFGTILKVLDCGREKVCAVKVVPKVEVLRRDTLKQCKEEVSIQRQVRHPFVHGLGDSWQGQRHLFIMCTYCSTGDLHALWRTAGCLAEATVRLFAAELVLVLVYLHDLGIMHRDVKMENILLDERVGRASPHNLWHPAVHGSLWRQRGTMWPCWNVSNRAAMRAHLSSALSWPGCSPSCCATTPCTACATSTTSRATPSSAGWPSMRTCCRRTRWWWRWPRDLLSSPHPTPPLLPTLTTTSPPPRTGPGLAEPPRLGPSASLRDIPLPQQRVRPSWAGSPKGLPGYPPISSPGISTLYLSPREQ
ncbi:ribosomal protein S6 kinase-related protein isoform X1 [Aphelocoma coerulescens]|uniref:ribosomal protein S6 kinase-related protein isoform X1 n=1 Tax=Aphelocoma coerulescens TaxID=39617 RepID=UPI003604DFF0